MDLLTKYSSNLNLGEFCLCPFNLNFLQYFAFTPKVTLFHKYIFGNKGEEGLCLHDYYRGVIDQKAQTNLFERILPNTKRHITSSSHLC